MMHTTLKENTMNIECKEYQIYIGCDDKRLYDDLHEAVDNVLKKHYVPTEEYGEDKWVVLIADIDKKQSIWYLMIYELIGRESRWI